MRAKILLLFFTFSFLFVSDQSFDQDLGRHLKLGEIIIKTGQIPKTNLFSYTNPDFPFINTHWLFEVIVFLASQTIGLQAFLIIKIVIFLISVFLILKLVPAKSLLLIPVGFIFLHVLRERLELRPEIFSFLFTAFTLFVLERFLATIQKPHDRDTFVTNTGLIALLPVIQLIWINTHIYFFVGLILQAIFLIELFYQYLHSHLTSGKLKTLGIVFVLSVMLSFFNPNGLTGVLYPLNVTKNYGYTIVENQTMFFLEGINFKDPNFLFVKISIAIIIFALILAFIKKKFEIKNILLSVFGVFLALMNVRSFPYLVFLSLPATMEHFGSMKQNTFTKFIVSFFGLILLTESLFYLNGDYYQYKDNNNAVGLKLVANGKLALDFVINNNLPNPIYNNFDIGSYIIYRGYPKYRVFVDGRPESYPKEFFLNTYIPTQSDYAKFKKLEEQQNFQTIIFSITDQTPWGKAFLTSVVKDDNWKIVYLDDFMIILVKKDYLALQGPTLQNLESVDLAKLNPSTYSFGSYLSYLKLALFLTQTGNLESAQKFAERGLSLFPQSPLGNAMFGINTSNKFFW